MIFCPVTQVFDIVTRDSDKYDFVLSASMVELYNSNVRDLLTQEKTPPKLDIHNVGLLEAGAHTLVRH